MTLEFVIPTQRGDLRKRTAVHQYVVDEVLTVREIPGALQELKAKIRHEGAKAVLSEFDVFYSVLYLQRDLGQHLLEDSWQLLLKVCAALDVSLAAALEEGYLETSLRSSYLNMVKMVCYLICQFMEMFDMEDTKQTAAQVITAGKGKGSKKKTSSLEINWEKEREEGMKALLHLVNLNLHRLWDPPIPDDDFVNLVTNCCYKLMENPAIARVSAKEARDLMSHIIGAMVKRYNHGIGCSVKIFQLLQHFEHLVSPLASTVQIITEEFKMNNIIVEIMREVGRLSSEDAAKDSSGTRSCASFLLEVTEKVPAAILPNVSLIISHLDDDPYTLRNCVLSIIGEILMKVLSKEGLDSKLKSTREQFLDTLEEHVHDVNAFVRSKVLQIYLNIVNEKCLPMPRQENLTKLVVGRLVDVSSHVRKYALQLVTALFKGNPFAAKLQVEELKASYELEKEKLEQMLPVEQSDENKVSEKLDEEWTEIAKVLAKVPTEEKKGENEELDIEVDMEDDETVQSVMERIKNFMKDESWVLAYRLLAIALKKMPAFEQEFSQEEFNSEDSEDSKDALDEEDRRKQNAMQYMKQLYFESESKSIHIATEMLSEPKQGEDNANVVNEVSKQQVLVYYLRDTLAFAVQIQKAVPIICQLLGSKTATDVLEAIEFFVTGFEFGLAGSMMGIRKMLPLIWSKEANIKDAMVAAYKRLYICQSGGNPRSRALSVIKNLTALISGATVGDLTSLEGLLAELMKSGDIEKEVVQMLWERFALKIPNTTEEESRAAILIIAMMAGADPDIVRINIDVLVSEGFGARGEEDFLLARETCLALLKLTSGKKKPGEVGKEPLRLSQSHEMFVRLQKILVQGVTNYSSQYWIPLAEQAIKVIYKLAEHPDSICAEIIKQIAADVVLESKTDMDEDEEDNAEDAEVEKHMGGTGQKATLMLTRLLSMVGQIAFCHLVYLEDDVLGEIKRRHAVQEENAKTKTPAGKKSKKRESKASENIEDELGLAGAAADDAEVEYIRKVNEQEVVTGETLLAAFAPVIVSVCTNQQKFMDKDLQTAATLALAKFMLVSSEFCEQYLQLLFTVLEKSPHATIRGNSIIALGDLTFRFPNLIEPWTPHMYARLRDDSTKVKQNTLQVLTHLILNDMVKVKGHISEIAKCFVDEDQQISGLAKHFFLELSRKGNAIYNVVPDLISRLSDPDVGVSEEDFRNIMGFLFSFIEKDKQCGSLVEKLCQRFRAARNDRQYRDLAYCLSLLSYSEKSLRKLQENFACIADKLAEDEVYNCFISIITKSRSFCKMEAKELLDDLENKLNQCHDKGLEDESIIIQASQSVKKKSPRKARTTGKTPGRGRKPKKLQISDSEDDEVNEMEKKTPARTTRRPQRTKKKPAMSFSSDEESDIELFDLDKSCTDTNSQTKDADSDADSDTTPILPHKHGRTAKHKKKQRHLLAI